MTDGALAEGLSIADEQVWLRLRNHVAREKGFWFGAIFASSTYGLDELARRASWFLGGQSRELRRIVASSPDELTAAVSDVLNGSLVGGLIWIEATRLEDSWAAAWAESLTALNRRRDTMRRELGGGLLLVGPPGLRRQLASQAVDLSSVRSFTAELAGRSMPALDITADDRVTFADVPIEVGDEVAATLRTIDRLRSSDQADAALDLAVDLLTEPLTATERIAALEASARAQEGLHLYQIAAQTLEEAVRDRERILGPDHPDTLTSRNNLASPYESVGDFSRAVPLFEEALSDRVRVLGPDHPKTLASRNNLASAYQSAGEFSRAVLLFEQTLSDSERVLGPDHPDTLKSRNNLAGAYQSAGDFSRALPLLEQTLRDSERVLGPDHPDTLDSRNNLAGAYESAGDLTRAKQQAEAALATATRVLSAGHPLTSTIRRTLESIVRSRRDDVG